MNESKNDKNISGDDLKNLNADNSKKVEKKKRLAEQLRKNLRRRKKI